VRPFLLKEFAMLRSCLFLWMAVGWLIAAAAPTRGAILEEGAVTVNLTGTTEVGSNRGTLGDGSLWITPPSTLTGTSLRIAPGFGGTPQVNGNVYVQGGAINVTQDIVVGENGRGLLKVTDGGAANAMTLTLAGPASTAGSSSQATLILDGEGTKARLGKTIVVGESGFAEASVTGGALLQSATQSIGSQAILGNRPGAVGTMVLSGPATAWQHGGPIHIGNLGTGSLHVRDGAAVSSAGASLGIASEGSRQSFGSATLEGEGTRWITTGLTIGDRGVGEVRVFDGALLDVTNQQQQLATSLGKLPGSFGRLIVSGEGSRWIDSRAATIGGAGVGELWIEDGAFVVNAGATLGQNFTTGSGLAVVRGSRTRWQAGGLTIGVEGSGWLRIEDGATVALGAQTNLGSPLTGTNGRLTLDDGTFTASAPRGFENRGVVEGHGSINVNLLNNLQNGQVLVGANQLLQLSGNLSTTQTGRVEIIDGELKLGGMFTNGPMGKVHVEGGTLRGRGEIGFANNGSATFVKEGNQVSGAVRNVGSIVAAADSELTFFENVRNTGAIKASAGATITMLGSLTGNGITGPGTVVLEGGVMPGQSPGIMNFGGDVTLGDLSELTVEISGISPGNQHDQFNVAGALNLSGNLKLQVLSHLKEPSTLTIVNAGELTGTFDAIPALGADLGLGVQFNGLAYDYDNDWVTISLLPGPGMQADFDLNGAVDGGDLLAWQQQAGASPAAAGEGADGNGDGAVDAGDLVLWQQDFAPSGNGPSPAGAAVPEPGAAALLLVGLLGLGGRRVASGRTLRF
jgi:T5SS/PEP-CTERM-associated repeat protein